MPKLRMPLDWPSPDVSVVEDRNGSLTFKARIPKVGVMISEGLEAQRRNWETAHGRWKACHGNDWSVWGPYARLGRTGRFRFPVSKQPLHGWPETHTAWLLERQGFRCWTSVQLFLPTHRTLQQARWLRNTEEVATIFRRLRKPFTRELVGHLDFKAKNPDLVAYRSREHDLRFCEVKVRDRPHERQLAGLAFLHVLTGAPVCVVQLCEEGQHVREWTREVTFAYAGPRRWLTPRWRRSGRR